MLDSSQMIALILKLLPIKITDQKELLDQTFMTLEAGFRALSGAVIVLSIGLKMGPGDVVFYGVTLVQATFIWMFLFFFFDRRLVAKFAANPEAAWVYMLRWLIIYLVSSFALGLALFAFEVEGAFLLLCLVSGMSWHFFDWYLKTRQDYKTASILKILILAIGFAAKMASIFIFNMSSEFVLWLTVLEFFLVWLALWIRSQMLAESDQRESRGESREYALGQFLQIAMGGWLSTFLMQWPMLLGENLASEKILASFYILSRFYDAGTILANQMSIRMYVKYSSGQVIHFKLRRKYIKSMFFTYALSTVATILALPVLIYFSILSYEALAVAVCLSMAYFPYFMTSFRNSWYLANKEFSAVTVHGLTCAVAFLALFLSLKTVNPEMPDSYFLLLILFSRFLPAFVPLLSKPGRHFLAWQYGPFFQERNA